MFPVAQKASPQTPVNGSPIINIFVTSKTILLRFLGNIPMDKKITAIVLGATDYKENDKMLTLLSPDGKFNVVLRGVKKKDAKLKSFAQPFCFAEFVVAGGALPVVTGASMQDAFYELAYEPEKYFCGNAILELASNATSYETPCPEVFLCVMSALRALRYTDVAPSTVFVKFAFELVGVLGYRQRYDACNICGEVPTEFGIDLTLGGLVCMACAEARAIDVDTARLLWRINARPWDELGALNADGIVKTIAKECERLLGVRLRSVEYL